MGLEIGGEIERVNGKELSYREFVERYLEKNQPVLISGLMDGWMASKDWVTENGNPNLAFFSIHFGKSKVQVADCGRRDFTDQKRIEMSVSGFISDWQQLSAGKYHCDSSDKDDERPLLYLKDWHFVKEYPKYVAYTTPKFFVDDWLNLYLDSHPMHMNADMCRAKNEINCSDYRFVYMGAQGTWTPLHADVFRNMKSSVYDIFDNVSNDLFPGFKKAVWLECTQEQGEMIFVPSGWYHQVLNLEDTISINHNWFNAYNLSWVWGLLLKDYNEAKEYIEDIRDICDDFESLCQRNLAANTGMNFFDFFVFITRFSFANLTLLYHLVKTDEHPIWASSDTIQHLIANLTSIHNVALSMQNVEAFAREDHSGCSDLKKILEEPEFIELCVALSRTYTSINGELKEASGWDGKSIHVEASSSYLDFLVAIGFEVNGPDDLIRITENAVLNLGCMDNGWSFRLSSESNHLKPQAVL